MKTLNSLADIIDISAQKYPNRPLFGYKVRDRYEWITYADFKLKMERLRLGFHNLGMKKGDVVAVISNNSVAFALTAYAAYGLGASIVPMYEVQKSEDWDYIIRDSGARFVFASNKRIFDTVAEFKSNSVEHIILLANDPDDADCESVDKILERSHEGMKAVDIDENSLADILYTSGTTGKPKGVELTHRNIIANAKHTFDGFDASCHDRSLSFLPWAHAFGKTVELHIFPYFGASVALAESARTIAKNLKEAQPTILVGVPKIFNKFYDTIHLAALKNRVTQIVFDITDELSLKSHTKTLTKLERLGLKVLYKAFAPKIHAAFGGKLRFCISGGAPLAIEIIHFFDSFGIPIFEGYGMTETSPIIAVNKPGRIKHGSVGQALNCNHLKIIPVESDSNNTATLSHSSADNRIGEVVVSGDCIMKAYHNLPALTAEVLNDGAFKTGDLGYIDEDGFLFLTGRVKEQFKLENGKYVIPGALEEKIKTSPCIEHAVIFGAGKPYNVVLIRPSDDFIARFSSKIKDANRASTYLEHDPAFRDALFEEVKKMGSDFRGYERPQKIAVTLDDFSIDNGLLTPALKVRRCAVEKKYKAQIDALYE